MSGAEELSERLKYGLLAGFALLMGGVAFLFNSPREIYEGNLTILASPANLLTTIALTKRWIGIVQRFTHDAASHLDRPNGRCKDQRYGHSRYFSTIAGFAFFGKNLFNSMPIPHRRFHMQGSQKCRYKSLLAALFGTALAPLVSGLCFARHPVNPAVLFLGLGAGFVSGFLIPLAHHFVTFTRGFSLYNVGFTCGIIGTVFISLMRNFGFEIETVNILASGYNGPFSVLLYSLFSCMF